MKRKSNGEDGGEVRHERLVIGQTTLPKGHSIGKETSALRTERFDRSPLFGRLESFMKIAEKNDDTVEKKDPVVILEKVEDSDSNNSQDSEKKETDDVELDIVLVKAGEKSDPPDEKEIKAPKKALIETIE